jgi:RNA polymerase sigma factor (sigma-70 family)
MPTSQMSMVIQHLRTAFGLDEAGVTDGELLTRFLNQRDDAAFAALIRRHAPMVWGVCHRLLRSHHDAEDAFQATFLVLARKAASVVPREMVGNWLYGVAHQTAVRLNAMAAKRSVRERQVVDMPEPVVEESRGNDLLSLLDQELSCLPEKYRVLIVLCDLESKTRKEVARQLAIPEGTVAGRLARARVMLAKRLARNGLAVSGGALAAVLAQNIASADVPTSVVSFTIKAALGYAAGQTAAAGVISPKVAALTEGVLKAMLMSKLKAVVAVVLVLGFIVTGATVLSCRTAAAQDDKPPAAEERVATPQKQEQEREKEGFTAWGKEMGGLQAGLGYRPGQKRSYSHGETVTLVVRIRNVANEDVKFRYLKEFFMEKPPSVTGGEGKTIRLGGVDLFGRLVQIPVDMNLAPGKEMELHDLKLKLERASEGGDVTEVSTEALHGKGKFQIQYKQLAAASIDPNLTKLATGKLELEVKEAEKQEKEGFTAWGKEIGGLQAGLGYQPGQKRAYSHGETVKLVVRVRNVGKEAVKFEYLKQFFVEKPPTVIDGKGKQVDFRYGYLDTAIFHIPVDVNLAPGKEIVLGEVALLTTLLGRGKFSVQYERVFGNSSVATIKLDPTLSKLATGKLELEIKSDPPAAPDKK